MRNVELLRAIARNPDDDTVRLAYADWLDEHDRPERAEFVRAQVELATLEDDSPRRREVAFRCRQLLDAHEEQWLEPRDRFLLDWHWSRGFVETFCTSPADLVEQDAALFDTHPFRRVWLSKLDAGAEGVSRLPRDNRIAALDLTGNRLTTNSLKRLAKATHLSHLTELGLMFNNLRYTAVKVLCGEPFFQRLSLIRLGANPFTPAAREQLRNHFGDRVTFAHEREPERLYTIQDDYLRAGLGKGLTQLLLFRGTERLEAPVFDHAGNLLHVRVRPLIPRVGPRLVGSDDEANRAWESWLEELGYESATIRVKRFRLPDLGAITDFNWWATAYDTPDHPERDAIETNVWHWLRDGWYRYDFGGRDAWFDRQGEVTAT